MARAFASEYPRNDAGLILFPRDSQYRKELFPKLNLDAHPAKANIYLVQAIIEYVSESDEDTILDIMAGTGTIMVAALVNRRVICIEIEKKYCNILEQGVASLEEIAPGISDMITIIPGDCSKILPIPADHIIFSPPYSNILKKSTQFLDRLSRETLGAGLQDYSRHPDNVGNLNEFLYHQRMELIYKRCYASLPPGGTLTIIIKDHIENKVRVKLGERAKNDCEKIGFKLSDWFRWLPPGTIYSSFMRARGDLVVDEEEIIILRR